MLYARSMCKVFFDNTLLFTGVWLMKQILG